MVVGGLALMLIPELCYGQAGRMHRATRRRTAVVVGTTTHATDAAHASAAQQQTAAAAQQQVATANQQAAAAKPEDDSARDTRILRRLPGRWERENCQNRQERIAISGPEWLSQSPPLKGGRIPAS